MKLFLIAALVAVFSLGAPSRDRNKKEFMMVCYYGTWAVYRPEPGKFSVEDIDPFICTHLVYGFAGLGADNKIRSLDSYLDLEENWGKGAFKRFNNLRKLNPELTTLLAIGGWNEGSTKYSNMASSAGTRKIFIDSCVDFLLKHDFDGLDLDWEYPAQRGGVPQDKETFITLLKEMKEAFQPHGLLLTAAVAAGKESIDTSYNIPEMSKYMDFINVMAYDFNGAWNSYTGHNAPLTPRSDETGTQRFLNAEYAIDYWIQQGAPPKKLTLGMGTYGRSFTLANPSNNGMGATTTGPGQAGPYTREGGMLGYNEICEQGTQWTTVWHDEHQVPYAYKGNQWVGYDNIRSIKLKSEFAKSRGLGGGMVWSIETDDFHGKCGDGKFPLITTIQDVLNGGVDRPDILPTLPPDEKTTAPTQPTKPTPPPDTVPCTETGWFRFPDDCTRYYQCVPGLNGWDRYFYECPDGTAFDDVAKVCNWKDQVSGC